MSARRDSFSFNWIINQALEFECISIAAAADLSEMWLMQLAQQHAINDEMHLKVQQRRRHAPVATVASRMRQKMRHKQYLGNGLEKKSQKFNS